MRIPLFLLAVCFATACSNNNSRSTDANNASTQTVNTGIPKDSVARDATFSFIEGCMQNARLTLGEQKAYAYCKCIYNQIKAENPGSDSIAIEELAMDTARVARMSQKCRPRE